MGDTDAAVAEVIATEQLRCVAWRGEDLSLLDDILADDIWYVHSNGRRDDKRGLAAMLTEFKWTVEREALDVQVYGDIAVMTGGIVVWPRPVDGSPPAQRFVSDGLQIWRKTDGRWQLIAQQSTARAS